MPPFSTLASSDGATRIALVGSSVVAVLAILAAEWYQPSFLGRHDKNKTAGPNHQDEAEEEATHGNTTWNQISEPLDQDTIPSIIEHFKGIELDGASTVFEANRRRTAGYYQKAREAHAKEVVPPATFQGLKERRKLEEDRIFAHYSAGNQSHRTVVVMCDVATKDLLEEARQTILAPLGVSHDPSCTDGVWIPAASQIPSEDLHVTVAVPWWWHSMLQPPDQNLALTEDLCNRFKQALVLEFHHPFQIELERILLLGGKTLVALWRTVGERPLDDEEEETNNHPVVLLDRHGTGPDPMVRLRREIVRCFTTEDDRMRSKPLTYHAHKKSLLDMQDVVSSLKDPPAFPLPSPITHKERTPSIEARTPGMGDGDGFIHTTLCRFPPADCFSLRPVELGVIHRLCREATAACAGHRMLVRKYRFLETTGEGGESNPCIAPLFDATVDAPPKAAIDVVTGKMVAHNGPPPPLVGDPSASVTIGAPPQAIWSGAGVEELFATPPPP